MDYESTVADQILKQMLECNTACVDFNSFHFEKPQDDYGKVLYYMKTLPGAEYVVAQMLNYIFSNGLTTGTVKGDIVLDEFLYKQKNEEGKTNYAVLRDVIANAIAYGRCGLRFYEGNIYSVDQQYYASLVRKDDGIRKVVGYVVSSDDTPIAEKDFKLDEIGYDDDFFTGGLEAYFEAKKMIFLDKSTFIDIWTNDAGESPLLKDELRLDLLITAYERLLHDLNYDGPGRLVLWAKSGFITGDANDISTSEVMSQAVPAQMEREKKAKKELREVTKQIKESGSDSAILLSDAFDRNVLKLPRVTKATEFFDWLTREGIILAQVFGMSPSLLELGDVSGNVSMEKIIDNSMLNSIVPLREKFAIQFSSMLADHLKVEKVYFNKYELQQAEDENTMRTKVVNIMSLLNSIKDEEGNTRADCLKLVNEFASMLSADIHHENGDLKALKITMKKTEEVKKK